MQISAVIHLQDLAKHLQLKGIDHLSMTVGQRSKDIVSEEEEGKKCLPCINHSEEGLPKTRGVMLSHVYRVACWSVW